MNVYGSDLGRIIFFYDLLISSKRIITSYFSSSLSIVIKLHAALVVKLIVKSVGFIMPLSLGFTIAPLQLQLVLSTLVP